MIGSKKFLHRIEFAEYNRVSAGGKIEGILQVVKDGESVDEPSLKGKVVLISERPEGFDITGTVQGAVELGVAAVIVEAGEPKWFSKTAFGLKDTKIPVLKMRKSLAKQIEQSSGQFVSIDLPLENGVLPCRNVLGYLPGNSSDHTFVISAHYDHLGDDPGGFRFPGAIDNTSGVVTVLEAARLLANDNEQLPFNIVIAFFSGEESGLQGAYQFIESFPGRIIGGINLDCIGQEDEIKLARIGYDAPEHWLPIIGKEVFERYGVEIKWKDYGGEDSLAFRRNNIPALGLGQKLIESGRISIHTPDDDFDALRFKSLHKWSRIVHDMVREIANKRTYYM